MQFFSRPVRQIAYYAKDPQDAARRHSAAFGSGPYLTGPPRTTRGLYRGEELEFEISYALGQWGEVMVEFFNSGDPTAVQYLPLEGRPQRLHHMALIVDDLDAEVARFEAAGYPTAFIFTEADFRPTFMNTLADLGHFIEIYRATPTLLKNYETVRAAAAGFDGADPIRGPLA